MPPKRRAASAPERTLRGGTRSLASRSWVGVTRAQGKPTPARPQKPLDTFIRGSQRLPLGAWEPEEREQFVTAFPQARYDARTPLAPRALEGRVCGAGGVGIRRVDDAMEVVANLGQGMLRRFTREIAQFVGAAALDGSPRPG